MADLAQLQTWLAEAESARHAIATGAGVQEFWRNGRRVVYSKNDLDALDKYILGLRREIEQATNAAAGRLRRSAIGIRL